MGSARSRADAVVRANRFTIAVVFPLVGTAGLVASREGLLGSLAYDPVVLLFGTAVMRLPLVVGLLPVLDRRGAVGLAGATAYTYAVEVVGVLTGAPYGEFSYGVELGPMLFGLVPAALPLFFLPLVVNAYLLVLLLGARSRWTRVAGAVGVVVLVDLVLDPGAVALGFWSYAAGGAYYGVPASNFAGWVLSGAVAVTLVEASLSPAAVRRRLRGCEFALDDFVSFLLLWGTVNAVYGQWVPVTVAAALFGAILRTGRFDFPAWRPRTTSP